MTGRRAVGNLLRHYDRMQRTHPDELPVVRLKVGGFQHRDERIGWVSTPVFAVVGRAPRDSAAKPDTSTRADMDDEIPFDCAGASAATRLALTCRYRAAARSSTYSNGRCGRPIETTGRKSAH